MDTQLPGKQYDFDSDGYLVNMSQWDTEIRDWLAKKDGIILNDEHGAVIEYIRQYYEEHEKHPEIRMLTTALSERLGREKGSAKYFHVLFPDGLRQADKLAGLPKRHSCC